MSIASEPHAEQPTGSPAAGPARTSVTSRWGALSVRFENLYIGLVLVALLAIFTLWAPPETFLTSDNLSNIALDASQLLILSSGVALLIIAGGLDLSVGAVVVFSAIVSGKTMLAIAGPVEESVTKSAGQLLPAVLAGLGVAVLSGWAWGALNSLITLKLRVPPIIATLATLSAATGLAQVVSKGVNVSSLPIQLQQHFGGAKAFDVVPWPVVVAAVVVAVLWVVLSQMRFGLRTYAIGSNAEAAARSGIPVGRHMLALYTLVGLLAGVVSFIDLSRFGTASLSGHTQDALNAIAAVVIGGVSLFGGRGRMSGVVIGVFIPAVLANGFVVVQVDPFWQNVAVGAVLVLAVYIDQLRRGAHNREG
ncbi:MULTISPECIES: ABC transporter permease [Micromonospora]|uniref:Monosaccharide ABC transporter membrane protein, CUT2 family n=1 Tax=Micromonospora inyonensis TaxID=47866 RepID=A0A1C6RJV7_9ACTN|nr:ABC transporter permease [Micromonospora inyonensis]SCL17430.1 monosaccharide ABC transporter membrane protein, CUT2 family [Micromonospora inyonensis]